MKKDKCATYCFSYKEYQLGSTLKGIPGERYTLFQIPVATTQNSIQDLGLNKLSTKLKKPYHADQIARVWPCMQWIQSRYCKKRTKIGEVTECYIPPRSQHINTESSPPPPPKRFCHSKLEWCNPSTQIPCNTIGPNHSRTP